MDAELDSIATATTASISLIAGASLCRVWIMGPGDSCPTCAMAPECPARARCLHLASSAGLTRRLDGPYRRFPVGAREVGRVATTLSPLLLSDGLDTRGLAEPAWLERHGIGFFGAWPLAFRGRCEGVVAVFARVPPAAEALAAIEAAARLGGAALGALRREASTPQAPAQPPPSMAEAQRSAILDALARARGRVSGAGGAAELLGMKPTTLESRIRKLGLRKPPRLNLR